MLWSLGLAAVTGVWAVLFQAGNLTWRVVGTGLTTAVACALLLPISVEIDSKKSRSAGMLGMCGVVLEFLMALMLIWDIPPRLVGLRGEEQIALTMLSLAGAVVFGMVFLRLHPEGHGRVAGPVGIIVTAAAFLLFMFGVWELRTLARAARSLHQEKLWETSGITMLFGSLAVCSLVGFAAGDRRHWRWAGIAGAAGAWLLMLGGIWTGTRSDAGTVAFSILTAIAGVSAYANLLLFCPLKPHQFWVRTATIASAILTAALVDLHVVDSVLKLPIDGDMLNRFTAAAGIVASCGTLALSVLARMNRGVKFEPVTAELREMSVVCPRCQKKQLIEVGKSACKFCKLRISIEIEEPRCPNCDYLLFTLTSGRCPECGTPIGEDAAAALV